MLFATLICSAIRGVGGEVTYVLESREADEFNGILINAPTFRVDIIVKIKVRLVFSVDAKKMISSLKKLAR